MRTPDRQAEQNAWGRVGQTACGPLLGCRPAHSMANGGLSRARCPRGGTPQAMVKRICSEIRVRSTGHLCNCCEHASQQQTCLQGRKRTCLGASMQIQQVLSSRTRFMDSSSLLSSRPASTSLCNWPASSSSRRSAASSSLARRASSCSRASSAHRNSLRSLLPASSPARLAISSSRTRRLQSCSLARLAPSKSFSKRAISSTLARSAALSSAVRRSVVSLDARCSSCSLWVNSPRSRKPSRSTTSSSRARPAMARSRSARAPSARLEQTVRKPWPNTSAARAASLMALPVLAEVKAACAVPENWRKRSPLPAHLSGSFKFPAHSRTPLASSAAVAPPASPSTV
mmetsp:Transcript_93413/g.278902  ORF Transcript_93413/g.278902 Transcript_93413/m.278902 type:complete len:344 (-) Transcript_93413:485-1516(-)